MCVNVVCVLCALVSDEFSLKLSFPVTKSAFEKKVELISCGEKSSPHVCSSVGVVCPLPNCMKGSEVRHMTLKIPL